MDKKRVTDMEKKDVFELKEEHLKLLRNMYVDWDDCEFGAPRINPKRPYGNSGVLQDMLELFGLEEIKEGGQVFKFKFFGKEYLLKGEDKHNIDLTDEKELAALLVKLHEETERALQIVLHTGQFKTGKYQKEPYGIEWELVIE